MFSLFFLQLPNDICELIEFYVKSNSVNIIIKYYSKKKIKDKIEDDIIYNLITLDNFSSISYEHSSLLYNVYVILSKYNNLNYEWWIDYIWTIVYNITDFTNYNFLNMKQYKSYNLSIYSCRLLAKKFNILSNVDYHIYHKE